MTDLSNPHDKYFREVFENRTAMREFVETYVPAEVVATLDLTTLEPQKDSFIDPTLQTQQSDLLYQVQTRDGEDAYVYLMLEHKSYPDPGVPFQLLRYMVSIWARDVRTKQPMRPILPLVVYHGAQTWRVATDFSAQFTGPAALRPYWPSFQYQLFDLSAYSDEEIQKAVNTRVALMALKYIFSSELPERLPAIARLVRALGDAQTARETLETLMRYVVAAADSVTEEDVAAAIAAATRQDGGTLMPTLAEKWIEQGIEQGIERGIEQGIEKGLEQGVRDSILTLLTLQFGDVSADIAAQLDAIDDIGRLRQLLPAAATAESIDAFAQALNAPTDAD